MTKLTNLLGIVLSYVVNVLIRKRTLIGADVTMSWDDENETLDYYASFAPDPGESEFDEYGMPDMETFYYFEDIKEAVRSFFKNGNEWTTHEMGLVFLSEE